MVDNELNTNKVRAALALLNNRNVSLNTEAADLAARDALAGKVAKPIPNETQVVVYDEKGKPKNATVVFDAEFWEVPTPGRGEGKNVTVISYSLDNRNNSKRQG